jgi:hypothetical protein
MGAADLGWAEHLPLLEIGNSVGVVRRNSLAVIWRQIAGSAYVGSGLSAARLEFYREQAARWRG